MRISNLDQVNTLVKIKSRCLKALEQLSDFAEDADDSTDSGGIQGYEYGYNVALHKFDDGSGVGANMNGCYVGRQMAAVTRDVLEEQVRRVDADLQRLGISFDDE